MAAHLLQDEASIAVAIENSSRFAETIVRRRQPGWLEIEVVPGRAQQLPGIVVMLWPAVWSRPELFARHLKRAQSGNYSILAFGEEMPLGELPLPPSGLRALVTPCLLPCSESRLAGAVALLAAAYKATHLQGVTELELERAREENQLLLSAGRALSQQRDIDALLSQILGLARDATGADAGSIYIVDAAENGIPKTLRCASAQNDSRPIESSQFSMPVSATTIVGAAVIGREIVNIPDLYRLDTPGSGNNVWGFVHDRSFDDRARYQARSMLTVPMVSARDEVIGVIQLINKRARGYTQLDEGEDFDGGVVVFDEVATAYAASLASSAGIALENARLYDEVKRLFDGFVRASVTAIEARDPTTSGHSERVAILTVKLAQVTDSVGEGRFASLRFSRADLKAIEYAALLHDFGKVGVREDVLVKAKKLYPHQLSAIVDRFAYIRQRSELEALRAELALWRSGKIQMTSANDAAHAAHAAHAAQLDDMLACIKTSNEPTVLPQGGFERIAEIASLCYDAHNGESRPYLLPEEVASLQIEKGSLSEAERREINSHVLHTYEFLQAIPWSRQLRAIPEIAGRHHEKIDGSGYPHGYKGDEVRIESRMMTISDIYDALTAKDRPYKRAIPAERALEIISFEVKKGQLDADLFTLFVDAKIWQSV